MSVSGLVIRPMGEAALLAEVDSLDAVLALHAGLDASRPDGVVELVPAARTVLVRVDPGRLPLVTARAWVERIARDAEAPADSASGEVVLDVVYDGADLTETAALLGASTEALVAAHTGAHWRVAFTGFAPGFGYLVSPDWPYDVPRLASPRSRVPAGSVGLAAGFSGAYPRETPGGWRLVGRSAAPLFDPTADAASSALLAPGAGVRFRAVRELIAPLRDVAPPPRDVAPPPREPTRRGRERADRRIRIIDPALFSSVQDLGRPGRAALGVARSGALDRGALRTANRLVGNPEDAAGVEVAIGGWSAVATADTWFAVTGAWGRVTLAGRQLDLDVAHPWPAGAELHLDWFAHGARAYLAVRGGVDVPPAVGSRSTDTMAGLGPARLQQGDELTIGPEPLSPIPAIDLAPWGAPPDDLDVPLAPGSRADWFAASALPMLFESTWTVSAQADRVGIRLDGPELPRARTVELPSEGMVPGALQVPPSGRPTILLADGPVTGGYPVIAVVTDAALDLLGQARPGTRIRFRHAR
ncbi:urea amidolyase family protein [Microbacterium rhizosphaerae]|uniref:Urea amidolyase family protein n=1 Tax=Microbacterium rhizosphaerae TaxID=1678237 RepID=A0ABZ0SN13_9MICO|nr:urea amidolyase family protein [Microbacterium rhizosphaerae]WPR90518.1 urea amidolyase family protein [Microbacterium rhizosphaerae]